ncbi:alpha-2 adrenergic receptor [Trichonephila clavipes]|nr:alpha-2 adrenergic receptor [Trichonephila clavipes]
MKIGNNGNLVLGPFDESTPCLMIVLMNCQTKLRINHLPAVKSVAILESNANLNFYTWKKNTLYKENSKYPREPRIKMGEALNSDNISNDCLICDKIGRSSELSSELGDIIKVTREEYQH